MHDRKACQECDGVSVMVMRVRMHRGGNGKAQVARTTSECETTPEGIAAQQRSRDDTDHGEWRDKVSCLE